MEQKRGDGKQILKGGQAGSRVRCLKKGRLEPPYQLWLVAYKRMLIKNKCIGGLSEKPKLSSSQVNLKYLNFHSTCLKRYRIETKNNLEDT